MIFEDERAKFKGLIRWIEKQPNSDAIIESAERVLTDFCFTYIKQKYPDWDLPTFINRKRLFIYPVNLCIELCKKNKWDKEFSWAVIGILRKRNILLEMSHPAELGWVLEVNPDFLLKHVDEF